MSAGPLPPNPAAARPARRAPSSSPGDDPSAPLPAALAEAALARWRQDTVNPVVAAAPGDERLLIRLEAEALAQLLLEGPAARAPRKVPGDALDRIRIALLLKGGLADAVAEAARERRDDPREPALAASRALDAHLARLVTTSLSERALMGETLVSLRALFASLRDGLIFMDPRGRVVDVNRSICEVTGRAREELVGRGFRDIWPGADPRWIEVYREVARGGATKTLYGLEYDAPGGDGPICFDLVVAPRIAGGRAVGTVSIVHYRTEQAKLERRLLHTEKMASVGRLSAGVAHEFRNLLAGVRALAELGAQDPAQALDACRRILDVADQATEVARGLLSFSRRTSPRLVDTDPGELLRDTVALVLSPRDRGRIEVRHYVEAGCPTISCDRGQIQQALVNLVRNAVEAMGRAGGTLALEARREGQEAVALSVIDSGPGIPEGLEERIFEPFFTTRELEFGVGHAMGTAGTGLGLPMVRAIAERHGGRLELRAGEGAHFRLVLPLKQRAEAVKLDRAAQRRVRPARLSVPAPELAPSVRLGAGGAVRALVVDDEPVLREILSKILERAGLEVEATGSIGQAMRKLKRREARGEPIDLVLLDLIVPGMRGPSTLSKLRRRYPDLKVCIVTGQALSDPSLRRVLRQTDAFVEKPFEVAAIVETARLLLGDRLARPEPNASAADEAAAADGEG